MAYCCTAAEPAVECSHNQTVLDSYKAFLAVGSFAEWAGDSVFVGIPELVGANTSAFECSVETYLGSSSADNKKVQEGQGEEPHIDYWQLFLALASRTLLHSYYTNKQPLHTNVNHCTNYKS